MLTIYLIILIFILFILLIENKDDFAVSMGKYLQFMKENRTNDDLTSKDIQLIKNIKNCYQNGNTYYDCINKIGIPYLENPKPNNRYQRDINYLKQRKISHLFPFQKN